MQLFENGKRQEFCPKRTASMDSLKRKLIMFFKEEYAAQSRKSEVQAELDRREMVKANC